jgi:hypothetical protein
MRREEWNVQVTYGTQVQVQSVNITVTPSSKSLIKRSSAEVVEIPHADTGRCLIKETCRATGRFKVETSILMMETDKVSEALVSSSTLMQPVLVHPLASLDTETSCLRAQRSKSLKNETSGKMQEGYRQYLRRHSIG